MITLDQYAYNIRNIARAGQSSSNSEKLSIKQIQFWINGYRAKGMLEITENGKIIDPTLIQDLGVVPLEEVDAADSSCPQVEWGCKVMKVTIPKIMTFPELRALSYVGKINKTSAFVVNYPDTVEYKRATKFGHLMSRAYLIENTLYFMLSENDRDLEYVNIRGVFESPTDVFSYANEGCVSACYDPAKDNYPMPLALYDYVTTNILTKELGMTLKTVTDELNNARQDNEPIR